MAVFGMRHIGLKVTSVALAASLWLAVAGEQIVERTIRIPLEFTNMPAGLETLGEPPEVMEVRVRGSSGRLSRVAAGELAAVVDLQGVRPGQRLFHVSASDIRAPFGVEVMQVAPATLYMSFEPSATKAVQVIPEIEGDPAPGYEVAGRKAEPATVEIVGPQSRVAAMTTAITELVSVAGASETVMETVSVGVSDSLVRLSRDERVRVTVDIRPAPLQWAVQGVPVRLVNARGSATLTPETITVHLRGPRDAMGVDATALDASVDVGGLKPGDYALPVHIVVPRQIGWTRIDPPEVRVRIR